MRITDLLDKRGISLDGAPKNKQEALDMAIELMNGVSHMLPFVVGGGILIALAFLIDGLCVDMNALAPADRANFGTITPIAAMLKNIGGIAFGFMLPVLAGFIAMAIGDRPALAVGFVGGMMAANGNSGSTGEDCAGASVSVIWYSDHRTSDELRYRACHGSN